MHNLAYGPFMMLSTQAGFNLRLVLLQAQQMSYRQLGRTWLACAAWGGACCPGSA